MPALPAAHLMSSSPRPLDTADPVRNFSLPTEARVRALASGPLAFMRRLRAIEDLEEALVRALVAALGEARAAGASPEAHARATAPAGQLEKLDQLIASHNRWYPVEANLPMHPRTGELIDRTGQPFRPMARRTLDELLARAVARQSVRSPGG